MPSQNGQRSIDLFRKNDPSELMGQRDAAKRKKKIGALPCAERPPICGSDGNDKTLSAIISQPAELSGELLGRGLLPAAVEQNCIGRRAVGGPIQPLEQVRLRVEQLRITWDISSGALDIVSQQTVCHLRFGSGAPWGNCSVGDLHRRSQCSL
jgi:hypothetical protein